MWAWGRADAGRLRTVLGSLLAAVRFGRVGGGEGRGRDPARADWGARASLCPGGGVSDRKRGCPTARGGFWVVAEVWNSARGVELGPRWLEVPGWLTRLGGVCC